MNGGIAMAANINLGDHAKRVTTFFDEFKAFALKGNVVDLAVGVIIGAAFAGLVKSLTDNIIMPVVGLVPIGDQGYAGWHIGPVLIGKFLGDIVNFMILAFVLYIFIVKFIGWIVRTKETAPPPPTKQEELLMEIRDLLKAKTV
jgi:large conductance mechanosensitive channel